MIYGVAILMSVWQHHVRMLGLHKIAGILLALIGSVLPVRANEGLVGDFLYWFPERFSKRLVQIDSRLKEIRDEVDTLPVMSDNDARGTHGFHSNFSYESEVHWFEMKWAEPQVIDGIGMIPTRIITQSGMRSNYGLPVSLRIEATREGEAKRFVLAEIPETRLDLRQGDPLFLELKAKGITSLRFIPINLPTLPGKGVRFFSLAEVMVYHGEENIARRAKLGANYSIDGEVGWNINYLIDEQSPLGPPELPKRGQSLGWHGDLSRGSTTATWALVDLGRHHAIDRVRLVGAQGDAPVKGPGFGFPVRFKLEISEDPLSGPWVQVGGSGELDMPNPGYNPMTFRFAPVLGRYVRLVVEKLHAPDRFTMARILLSEFEVFSGGQNLALGRPVSTPDSYESIPHDSTRVWSRTGLTDGYSSTGFLISERKWVSSLARRFDLICEVNLLSSERDALLTGWRYLVLVLAFGVLSVAVMALGVWLIRLRLENRRTVLALRTKISSDLHDEVGSNLATIALLSELKSSSENLDDINRLSRETSLALREIVEITLAPQRPRKPLLERLREIASLMLRDHEWSFEGEESPDMDLEQRKNLVFFFKESLHNILRHANAKSVRIVLEKLPTNFRLTIEDNGGGMVSSGDPAGSLRTLRQRADRLGGSLSVESDARQGTRLVLIFPIQSRK